MQFPIVRMSCVKEAAFTLVKLKNPVDWGSLDDEPVDYRNYAAAPESSDNVHLKMLSGLAVSLMDDNFRESLKDAADVEQIINIFKSRKE